MKHRLGLVVLIAPLALGLTACERQMRDMYQQPRFDPGEGSTLWPDGRADRAAAPGTVPTAAGDIAGASSGRQGRDVPQAWRAAEEAKNPPPISKALLVRGQERYTVYCVPCHSVLGDGDGPVTRHGFPHPPTYHQARLRDAPDRYLFDVITQGHGIMYGYADRVSPQDRWAIVTYIRALQLARNAPAAQLPPALQAKLNSGASR